MCIFPFVHVRYNNSSPIPRILRQIMVQLNESIEKNCAILDTHPLLALDLQRGREQQQQHEAQSKGASHVAKKDVKKAYRSMILKYHPDKNQDCDTSRIFTAIQAAYERLLVESESETESELHSCFPTSSGGGRRRAQQQQHAPPAPRQPKPQATASRTPRDEDYYSTQYSRCDLFMICALICLVVGLFTHAIL